MTEPQGSGCLEVALSGPNREVLWPVSSGIPLPRGVVRRDSRPVLTDSAGTVLPCVAEPREHWPDGSVKWLTLNGIMDLRRCGSPLYLRLGRSIEIPWNPPDVRMRVGGVEVRAGEISFTVPHHGAFLLEALCRNAVPRLRRAFHAVIEEADGARHEQTAPSSVRVERCNAVQTRILVEGHYAGPAYAYACRYRVTAYSLVPLIHVEHSLICQCPDPSRRLRRSEITSELVDEPEGAWFSSLRGSRLEQHGPGELAIDGTCRAGRHDGTLLIPSTLAACVEDFWQRYPKSLCLSRSLLTFGLLDDTSVEGTLCARGEAQTHDLWLWLGEDAPPMELMGDAVARRPLFHLSPERMCSSGAFGTLRPRAEGIHRKYESRVEAGLREVLRLRETRLEYGYRDYGDTRFEMLPDAWLNGEYDWAHAYCLQYARTADRRYLDIAAQSTHHVIDTDTIHFSPPPDDHLAGAPHEHSTSHTSAGVDLGHAWVEGMFEIAAMLDDQRIWEHAVAAADFFARCTYRVSPPQYKDRPGARRPGWGLIALTCAYEHTGDARYLSAAGEVARICRLEQIPETGAWVYPGGGLDDPRYPVGKTFMVALTLAGLMRCHEIRAEDWIKDTFLKGVDWAIDAMWDEKVGGFRYIDVPFDSPERSPGSSASHMVDPLWYAYGLTGDERYRYVVSHTWEAWIERGEEPLLPKDVRDTVRYLPNHRPPTGYRGAFPLSSLRTPEPKHIRGFCFGADGRGLAVGLFGLLMQTTDGGASWKRVDLGRARHLYAARILSADVAIAAGEGEEIVRTEDGGSSWSGASVLNIPLRGASLRYFYDLALADQASGYAAGYAVVARTEDGGKSWRRVWDAVEDGRWNKLPQWRALHVLSPGRVLGVGSYGLAALIENDGREFRAVPDLRSGGLCIGFSTPRAGFVCDPAGTIWKSTDAGLTWQPAAECGLVLWGITFTGESCGFACGEGGSILLTRDGGNTWTRAEAPVTSPLRAIAAVDERTIVAGGDDGVLLRTEDGGANWATVDAFG